MSVKWRITDKRRHRSEKARNMRKTGQFAVAREGGRLSLTAEDEARLQVSQCGIR
jgi:hypothetical protein